MAVPSAAPFSSPLFRPFASDPSATFSGSSTPPPPSLPSAAPAFSSSSWFSSVPPVDPSAAFGFGASEDLPEDSPPDTVPRVLDPGFAAVPVSVCFEFLCMMGFIVDLFHLAASLLLLVFSSKTFSSPIFLNWFEGVWSALSEADSHLASFVASGRGDFLFLPSRSSSYAVHGDFALGGAAPINPSLLSLFERRLKPSHHVGLSIREAAALEASLRSQSEALLHSMWVISASGLCSSPEFHSGRFSLFHTLVTSLHKSLAHQASLTETHTVFLGLKRHQ